MRAPTSSWNHSTHHHGRLLGLLAPRPEAALDVGCGDGSFAALLSERCDSVVAVDKDPGQVAVARERCAARPNVRVLQEDFLTAPLPCGHFDVVTALASFHHMPFDAAADRAAHVLRPGGRLIVLGVWTDRATPRDLALSAVSSGYNMILRHRRGPDSMSAPAVPPTMSLPEVRTAAGRHLPGARVTRLTLWRYVLIWDKPATAT